MDSTTLNMHATYNPNLDTLHLRTPGCTGKYLDSEDGIFFFTVLDHWDSTTPCGFEVHFFSEVWNDEEIIPDLDMRFEIADTDLRDAGLDEVLRWAFETYIEARHQPKQLQYGEQRETTLEAVHEDQNTAGYPAGVITTDAQEDAK
jgi:hypothetical protein